MSPQSLAKAIDVLVSQADASYAKSMGQVQERLYNQLAIILKGLELDSDGYILQNSVNRKILSKVNDKIAEVFSSNLYTSAVSVYVNVIPKVDLQNVKYFKAIDESFKPNRIFLKNLQTEAVATVEKYILRDGLQSQVINPLSQILSQNINSGGRFTGFLQQVRTYILGDDKIEGRALSYTRTYLMDTLFTYSRSFQQSLTNDLRLEFYLYAGGLIETSRPFCIERAGKYFSHKEVESWADLEWSGKKQGTTKSSIFLFAGGHSCSHELIPVHSSIVPKDVIDRQ